MGYTFTKPQPTYRSRIIVKFFSNDRPSEFESLSFTAYTEERKPSDVYDIVHDFLVEHEDVVFNTEERKPYSFVVQGVENDFNQSRNFVSHADIDELYQDLHKHLKGEADRDEQV